MRVFWALIAALVVAAGAAVFLHHAEPVPAPLPESAAPDVIPQPSPAPAGVPSPAPSPAPKPAEPSTPLDAALKEAGADAGVKVDLPAPAPSLPTPAPAPSPEPAKPTPAPTPPAAAPPPVPSAADMTDAITDALGEAPAKPLPEAPVGVTVTRQDDGTLLIDQRFVVSGEGTPQSPYVVAWEFLTAASETYKPRMGMTKLPGRLEIINNKYVRITGFVAFPIMAQSPDEMLAMYNQWDGCCIGTPPTPYDAVEVKLKEAVSGENRLKTFGTVEGVFKVDPYLVKDWLVGLYTMKDAKLSNTTGINTSPHLTKPQP
jgi:hypothetical protein